MVYDIITYNGEKEILDIRFNVLYPHVDKFIIIEFDETFSGKKKPKYLLEDWSERWSKFLDKIDYVYIGKNEYGKYEDLAETSPNVPRGGPAHWKQEFCQKESIKDALLGLEDEDLVFIGDCDEIWNPEYLKNPPYPCKLKLKVYSYFLDNRSTEEFWGPIVAHYKDIKDKCLNHLRSMDTSRTTYDFGWHFTSMGGYEDVKRKLTDSYTEDSYASPQVMENLEKNINSRADFLGRSFTYKKDKSDWPKYLKNNRTKYKELCLAPLLRGIRQNSSFQA